ncbi:MAG: hypothetical protein QGH82_06700, partial [Candidatus Woesearchaeota archaeon]|nr:hypothetical protein [Candidatus Woesearchaeota archaeon]
MLLLEKAEFRQELYEVFQEQVAFLILFCELHLRPSFSRWSRLMNPLILCSLMTACDTSSHSCQYIVALISTLLMSMEVHFHSSIYCRWASFGLAHFMYPNSVIALLCYCFPALGRSTSGTFPCEDIGADGLYLRTESVTKALLRSLGYHVRSAETFGRNDCLIDSILQGLQHARMFREPLTFDERKDIAARVRSFLRSNNHTRSDIDDYLSHDVHVAHILNFLLTHCHGIWLHLYEALRCDFTVVVYDRFNLRRITDVSGIFYELPETEPLCVQARLQRTCTNPNLDVQLLLYCHTHRDGTGWHYEWISASEEHAQDATHVSKSGADSSSACTGHPSEYVPASLDAQNTNMDGLASAEAYECSQCGPAVSDQVPMSVEQRFDHVPSVFEQMGWVTDEPAPTPAEQCGPAISDQMPMSVEQRSDHVPSLFEQMGMVTDEPAPMSVEQRSDHVPSVFEQMGWVTDEPAPIPAEQFTVWGSSLLQEMEADR